MLLNSSLELCADLQPNGPGSACQERPFRDQACTTYLLVCQSKSLSLCHGLWRFTLETADGEHVLDAGDEEQGDLNRLALLAAVRGLEAIDGAAAVTLLSQNRYLIRSLTGSLPRWRENDYAWEHFGQRIDVQHADLWRRIDRALEIHFVDACLISSQRIIPPNQSRRQIGRSTVRIDRPHHQVSRPASSAAPQDRLRRWLLSGGATTLDQPSASEQAPALRSTA